MMRFGYNAERDVITIRVPWERYTVELIKSLPEKAWIKKTKTWEIPVTRESVRALKRTWKNASWHPHILNRISYWEQLRELEKRSRRTNNLSLRGSRSDGSDAHTVSDIRYVGDFSPKRKSFLQQIVAFNEAHDRDFYALLMEMGTGKTKIAIDLMDYWFTQRLVTLALVVCPNTVKGSWELQVEEFSRYGETHRVDSGYTGKRLLEDLIKRSPELPLREKRMPIVVTNYEALRTQLGPYLATLLSRQPSVMILDESCSIKNGGSQQTAAALALGTVTKKRLIMDGTPIGNDPLDLFTQCKFLSTDVLGFDNFYAFRAKFAQMGGHNGKVPIHWQNIDVLRKRILGHGYRVLKKDCLDLPEKVYEIREVAMTKAQDKVYRRLRDEMVIELSKKKRINITNSFSMLTKLAQVASGFANIGTGEEPKWVSIIPPEKNQKLQELVEIVIKHKDERPAIYCCFNREIKQVREALQAKGLKCAVIKGSVKPEIRDKRIARFQKHGYDCIIMQVKIGSIGITITACSLVIYYSNTFNMRLRLQSEDRPHRIGQKRNVTYIDLLGTLANGARTIEHRVWNRLRDKKTLADLVTGDALKTFIS